MKTKTLSLVDDDRIFQFLTEKSLNAASDSVGFLAFDDGKMAIEYFRDNINNTELLPEVILLDINMPVLDGWGFLHEYNKLKSNIKKVVLIYIVTSSNNPKDMERAKQIEEVSGYMLKPVSLQNLQKVIESYPAATETS